MTNLKDKQLIQSYSKECNTGKCAKYCKKGKPCTVLGKTMTFDVAEHTSTFCFAVYTKDTGSTKTSSELELLKLVHKKGAGLFACDEQVIYCDVEEN